MSSVKGLSKVGLKELRFLFSVDGAGSVGIRSYIKNNYTKLQQANPDVPVLLRYGRQTEAKILATYPRLTEKSILVENMNEKEVDKIVQELCN